MKTISKSQVRTLVNLIRTAGLDVESFMAYQPFDSLEEMPECDFEAAETNLWVRIEKSLGG